MEIVLLLQKKLGVEVLVFSRGSLEHTLRTGLGVDWWDVGMFQGWCDVKAFELQPKDTPQLDK